MTTSPVAIELVENAISTWIRSSTAATPYFVEPEASGAPEPAPPRAQIRHLTLVRVGQPEIVKIPSIMQQRYTCAAGPGTVGVDFYTGIGLGESPLTPTVIRAAVGAVSADDAALALLAELVGDLPAGVTAQLDPEDSTSVLVDGSAAVPLFAASGLGLTSVTTLRQRFPELEAEWSRWSWSVRFFAAPTRGFGTASDLHARAKKAMFRILRPLVGAAGWELKGILADVNNLPSDRSESRSVLDFALEGYATAAYQLPALRAVGLEFTT